MNNLILISGKKQCGKDTIGEYLVKNYSYKQISFADELKRQCLLFVQKILSYKQITLDHFYNNILKETPIEISIIGRITPRKILQDYGTLLIRNWYPDYWVKFVIEKIKIQKYSNVVITDVRFPNEISLIREELSNLYNIHTFRIKRITGFKDNAESEIGMDNISDNTFNLAINNNETIKKLYETVDKYLLKF